MLIQNKSKLFNQKMEVETCYDLDINIVDSEKVVVFENNYLTIKGSICKNNNDIFICLYTYKKTDSEIIITKIKISIEELKGIMGTIEIEKYFQKLVKEEIKNNKIGCN